MDSEKVNISNAMSLEDNIRIISAYNSLSSPAARRKYLDSHVIVRGIIKNSKEILSKQSHVQDRVKSVNSLINLHKDMRQEFQKITLLKKVLQEWFHRFTNQYPNEPITIKVMRERADMAMLIMNITMYNPANTWLSSIRTTCSRGKAKYGSVTIKTLPLDIKTVIRYVLEEEGISRKKAQYTFGIQAFDEEAHHLDSFEFIDDECSQNEQGAISVEEGLEPNNPVEDIRDCTLITSTEPLREDSKIGLEHLKQETDDVALASETTSNNVLISNDQDALQYLQPLRHYMFSQNNTKGLDLLTQIETILIKPEN